MATPKQILANRQNAKHSTGPRTLEGKSASSANALKTGIDARSTLIRGEDRHAFIGLSNEYYQRWEPATPEERFLLDTMITAEWFRRRYVRVEAQLWELQLQNEIPHGEAYEKESANLSRLQRRLDAAERSYHRALKELQRLQAARTPAEPSLETLSLKHFESELASFLTPPDVHLPLPSFADSLAELRPGQGLALPEN